MALFGTSHTSSQEPSLELEDGLALIRQTTHPRMIEQIFCVLQQHYETISISCVSNDASYGGNLHSRLGIHNVYHEYVSPLGLSPTSVQIESVV